MSSDNKKGLRLAVLSGVLLGSRVHLPHQAPQAPAEGGPVLEDKGPRPTNQVREEGDEEREQMRVRRGSRSPCEPAALPLVCLNALAHVT